MKTLSSFVLAFKQHRSITLSNTLETTCLSRSGMYFVLWETVVGAKASMMVSRLAVKPCVFNQRAEETSRELEKRDWDVAQGGNTFERFEMTEENM